MSARRVRRTSIVLTAFLIVTFSVLGSANAGGRDVSTRVTKTVRAIVSHWSPTTVRISRGDVVKWRAISGTHTVTAYGANWSFNKHLSPGEVEDRRFRRAGTFRFRCTFHSTLSNGHCSGMCGKVVVTD